FLVGHVYDDEGPKDARWATGGIRLTMRFGEEAPPPPPPPPPPPAVVQAPPPPTPAMKRHYVLHSVNFDFNKANVKANGRETLDEIVNNLKNNKDWNVVVVEGHTDSVG